MAGGWQDLTDTLNAMFADDTKRKKLAQEFKDKHGNNGNGGASGKKPYKFGHFVNRHDTLLSSDRAKNRFLMDSGSRHWGGDGHDPRAKSDALLTVEAVVKHSLTHTGGGQPQPKQITFTVQTDYNAGIATADVIGYTASGEAKLINGPTDTANMDLSETFDIFIKCPPTY